MSDSLKFNELREVNLSRCEAAFHPLDAWSYQDWVLAMIGEAGEACNAVKKIKRGDGTEAELAKELADVVIYADLLAARAGIDLGKAVREKFNEVSERRGVPHRL